MLQRSMKSEKPLCEGIEPGNHDQKRDAFHSGKFLSCPPPTPVLGPVISTGITKLKKELGLRMESTRVLREWLCGQANENWKLL